MATRAENAIRMIKLIHERPRELTATDLSRLLGVSVRGVYRCLETLVNVGIPVRSKRKGGYELLNGWGELVATHFDSPTKRNAVTRLVLAGMKQYTGELQGQLTEEAEKEIKLSLSLGRRILQVLRTL